jgi:hypothetical protein
LQIVWGRWESLPGTFEVDNEACVKMEKKKKCREEKLWISIAGQEGERQLM